MNPVISRAVVVCLMAVSLSIHSSDPSGYVDLTGKDWRLKKDSHHNIRPQWPDLNRSPTVWERLKRLICCSGTDVKVIRRRSDQEFVGL